MSRVMGWQMGLLCVIGTISAGQAAHAETVFTLYDEATGKTGVYTEASHRMWFSGSAHGIRLNMEHSSDHQPSPDTQPYLYASLSPPPGATFTHGMYPEAGCRGATAGRAASLQVTLDNPLCFENDHVWGWISIRQLELDSTGRISRLEAAFSQRLGSPDNPGWVMTIRHNAKPQSFTINAGRRSPYGAVSRTFYGDEALFGLWSSNNEAGYSSAALKNEWRVFIGAPSGERLRKGRYSTGIFSPNGWWVQLERGNIHNPLGCRGFGTLDVADAEYDSSGRLVALRASFQQTCSEDRRVRFSAHTGVSGEIRYNR